ncbi:MAG: signal peptidase I [Candidatus Nomurabacteria bacterium]|jgi:signal peptidase|nr:signal peptidase I [Candidatus Nomurabacteria bacterium]
MRRARRVVSNIFLVAALIFLATVTALFVLAGHRSDDLYLFDYKPFLIATGSMETQYMTNSFVVIKKGGFENVKVGDAIAFHAEALDGKMAFHRVVRTVETGFVTKGDFNDKEDAQIITAENFIGHEVFHSNLTAQYMQELARPGGVWRVAILPGVAVVFVGLAIYLLRRWQVDGKRRWLTFFTLLAAVSLTALVTYLIWNVKRAEYTNQYLSSAIEQYVQQSSGGETTINGNKIIGLVEIEKLNLRYPIIAYHGDDSLNISIAHYSGEGLNRSGNTVLLGHRTNSPGLFFTDLDKLSFGDVVKITDGDGVTVEYKIFDSVIIEPSDLSVLDPRQPDGRELTLISCAPDMSRRYVVRLAAD